MSNIFKAHFTNNNIQENFSLLHYLVIMAK